MRKITRINNTDIYVNHGNILDLNTDVIVNPTNPGLSGSGGIDASIHKAAGEQLYEYCKNYLLPCNIGQAKISPSFNLKNQKFVIHTTGPAYNPRFIIQNQKLLRSCYISSLNLAMTMHTIAFPLISTGSLAYPLKEASRVALEAVKDWLYVNTKTDLQKIIFCLYTKETYDILLLESSSLSLGF